MATIDDQELQLLQWMRDTLAHKSADSDQVYSVVDRIQRRVATINAHRDGTGPYLTVTFHSLKRDESGFIRIERTAGRHQSVLLPIIDYRGSVKIDEL